MHAPRFSLLFAWSLCMLQCALPKLTALDEPENGDGDGTTDNTGGNRPNDTSSGDGDDSGDGDGDPDGSGGDDNEGGDGDGDGSGGTDDDGSGGTNNSGGNDGSGGRDNGSGGADPGPVCGTDTEFTIEDGYVSNGSICGYAWTVAFNGDATIDPPCGETGVCFDTDAICASGTIPANDPTIDSYPGIVIGMDAQSRRTDARGGGGTWSAAGSLGMAWTAGGATGEARLLIQTASGDYCVPNARSGQTYPLSAFSKQCWEGGAQSPILTEGIAVQSIALQINGNDSPQAFTDLCITNVINN